MTAAGSHAPWECPDWREWVRATDPARDPRSWRALRLLALTSRPEPPRDRAHALGRLAG